MIGRRLGAPFAVVHRKAAGVEEDGGNLAGFEGVANWIPSRGGIDRAVFDLGEENFQGSRRIPMREHAYQVVFKVLRRDDGI